MFGFGKKEVKAMEERLADLQRKKDWAGVSRTYYELGVTAMDAGDLQKPSCGSTGRTPFTALMTISMIRWGRN